MFSPCFRTQFTLLGAFKPTVELFSAFGETGFLMSLTAEPILRSL